MLVACYIVNSLNQNSLKPDTLKPDYITQPDETGSYTLSNLPNATYRLFAFNDDDRSTLYNKEFEKIAVLPSDITVKDSIKNTGNNFLFKNFELDIKSKEFFQSLKSDSLNIVFSSIENYASAVPPDSRFYFYFKNTKINKLDIADNLKLVDSSANANVKIAFNWLNDSLLQVFAPENLKQGRTYEFNLKSSSLNFRRIFKTTSENQIGNISGSVTFTDTTKILQGNIQIQLIRKNNPLNRYTLSLVTPGPYKFENISEGEYILFAFIDVNSSGGYDYGKYFPYEPSEPFFVFDKELKAKGMWNTDNVQVVF